MIFMRTHHIFQKLLLVILFCVSCYFSGNAQNVGGGLTLGLNASQIDGDSFKGFNKAGIQAGGFVYFKLSDKVKFQPEIVFDQLGSNNKINTPIKLNYVSVPILLNFNLPIMIGENEHNIEIHAGPVLGILLSAKGVDIGGNTVEGTDGFDNPDLRAVAGLGLRTGNISFVLRYGYSILSFTSNNSNLPQLGGAGWFHNYASFSVRFHLFDS